MNTPMAIQSRPLFLLIEQANDPEAWLEIRGIIDQIKEIVRALDDACDAKGLEVVRAHGDFQCGTKRWYEGHATKVKPRMVASKLINFLRDKLGGDEDAVERCLSSSAIKHGQARKELEAVGAPDAFDEAFESEVVSELATGKPKKELKCIDTRFVR